MQAWQMRVVRVVRVLLINAERRFPCSRVPHGSQVNTEGVMPHSHRSVVEPILPGKTLAGGLGNPQRPGEGPPTARRRWENILGTTAGTGVNKPADGQTDGAIELGLWLAMTKTVVGRPLSWATSLLPLGCYTVRIGARYLTCPPRRSPSPCRGLRCCHLRNTVPRIGRWLRHTKTAATGRVLPGQWRQERNTRSSSIRPLRRHCHPPSVTAGQWAPSPAPPLRYASPRHVTAARSS